MASMSYSSPHGLLPTIHARGALTSAEAATLHRPLHRPEPYSTDVRPYNTRNINCHPSIEAAFIVDSDPTKDFDPENAHDLQQNQKFPTSIRHYTRPFNPCGVPREPKEKVNTWQAGRQQGLLGRISVKLNSISAECWQSERGQHVHRLLADWTTNWPVQYCESDNYENSTELQLESICKDRLRHRGELRRPSTNDHGGSERSGWEEVTLGHPAARGCKTCYELGIECTLVKGEKYPCESCQEDDNSCELIMEPKKKRACESCTKRRVTCSFRTQEDHAGPCHACEAKGITCVAGPKSGYTRSGPCLDFPPSDPFDQLAHPQDPEKGPAQSMKRKRKAKCAQCKESRSFCSLSSNPKAASCARCRKLRLACMHQDASGPYLSREVAPSPEAEAALFRPRPARHWVFDDKVEFNYHGASSCDWCKCESHGFFGLAKNSEYLKMACEKGLIDAKTFRSLPRLHSRMCSKCTFARIEILSCLRHELGQLESPRGEMAEGPDSEETFVLPGMASLAPWAWCMVCPRVARFRCCRQRPRHLDGVWETCELRLCRTCACALALDHDGDLNELIRRKEMEWETELDLRADANFLCNSGALLARFLPS